MSFRDKTIRIDDWACNFLYIGPYDSKDVDTVLNANRCPCDDGCIQCGETGYIGDFTVKWIDEDNSELNVYEYINY